MSEDLKNDRLKAEIVDGRLVISIGVETLEWASRTENGGTLEGCKVDPSKAFEFARDVAKEIMRDDDVGEIPISVFLDKMISNAADSGSEAIIWPPRTLRKNRE